MSNMFLTVLKKDVKTEEAMTDLKILTGNPTRKSFLRKPWLRWEDNIRMDLKEIGVNKGIGLIQLRIGIIGEPL